MFRLFLRRRQAAQASRYARLGLEVLEGRPVPSVSIIPFADAGNGGVAIGVFENDRNDAMPIIGHTTTVVLDAETRPFDHLVTLFDLEFGSQKDALFFDLAGAFSQRLADLLVHASQE